jgi:hypothetical protein
MSGGYFDYDQYRLTSMADSLELVIDNPNEYQNFSPATVEEFRYALHHLRLSYICINAIDYLLSGDHNEESFHRSLKEKLDEYYARANPIRTG